MATSEQQSVLVVTIGSTTRTYRLWETTAPAAYDYPLTTLHVYGDPAPITQDENTRLVLVADRGGPPERDAHPQIMRYRSGLYRAEPSDLLAPSGQGGLEEVLWSAIGRLGQS